jgi:hypothetical protein
LQRFSHVFVLKVSLDIVDLNALASTVKEARTSGRPRKPAGGLINEDLVILDDATEEVNVEWEEERSDFEGKDNGEEVRGLGTTPRSPRAPTWDHACPYLSNQPPLPPSSLSHSLIRASPMPTQLGKKRVASAPMAATRAVAAAVDSTSR